MEIKASDVAKLRQMTGAGMMDCKKALVEAEGDFNRAQEIIREKGKLVAAKRSDRETTEGKVVALVNADNTKAIITALGCETDFVAKNAEFQELANNIANTALENFPADLAGLMACSFNGQTVEDAITQQTGKSGEKHAIPFYASIEAPFIASYMHVINGKLAAIVGFNKAVSAEVGKGLAMQVASMNPVALDAESVPQEVINNELTVAVEKTKEELVLKAVEAALKKAGINPTHVDSEDHIESNMAKGWITAEEAKIQNIAKGRLGKFFKENTLLEQAYQMGDGKQTVKEFLASVDKDVKVVAFKRFSLND